LLENIKNELLNQQVDFHNLCMILSTKVGFSQPYFKLSTFASVLKAYFLLFKTI